MQQSDTNHVSQCDDVTQYLVQDPFPVCVFVSVCDYTDEREH